LSKVTDLTNLSRSYLKNKGLPGYIHFWKDRSKNDLLTEIVKAEDVIVAELVNSRNTSIITRMNEYPIISLNRNCAPFKNKYLNILSGILFPLGFAWYLQALFYEKRTCKDLEKTILINEKIDRLIDEELRYESIGQ
jgi:lipopolysaccharide export system permease protein